MALLALQPASQSSSEVAQHFKDTVETRVVFEKHRDLLADDVLLELRRLFPGGTAQFWGVAPGRSGRNTARVNRLGVGDGVAFYGDRRLYAAGRIAVRFDNEALAERLWGRDSSGQTWSHMYALIGFHEVKISVERLQEIMGWKSGATVQGFLVVEGDAAEQLAHGCELFFDEPLSPEFGVPLGALPERDHVEWQPDNPAERDYLKRGALAQVLATRLRSAVGDQPSGSFLLHIDGPWGSGKSTLLGLLEAQLREKFLVVTFDAWRNTRVDPPWWALLSTLRSAVIKSDAGPTRFRAAVRRSRFRAAEIAARLKRAGQFNGMAVALGMGLALFAILILCVSTNPTGLVTKVVKNAAAIGSAVTLVSLVVKGVKASNRLSRWESAGGARKLTDSTINPMDQVAGYFTWLVARSPKPVLVVIDDLDRCEPSYVVALLESIQTLVRVWKESKSTSDKAPCFVVAADGSWLRRAYEIRYADFKPAMDQPGRPLGYLFLDKMFQLSVPMPAMGESGRAAFLERLLEPEAPESEAELNAEEAEIRYQVAASQTESEVLASLQHASQAVRERVAAQAVRKLAEASLAVGTDHALHRYAHLLDPNPRSMKRYINTYSVNRAVRTLEGNIIDIDKLARWVVVLTRWPQLAQHLQGRPSDVEDIVRGKEGVLPDELAKLLSSADVRAVLGDDQPYLDENDIRACCGEPLSVG